MEVEYELTREDFAAFAVYFGQTSTDVRKRHRLLVFGLAAMATAMFVVAAMPTDKNDAPWSCVAVGAAILAFAIIWSVPSVRGWCTRMTSKQNFKANKRLANLGRIKLSLSEEGLVVDNKIGHFVYFWDRIEKLGLSNDYGFAFTGANEAIIIPRRAFSSDADFVAFAAEAEKRLNRSRSGDASTAPQGTARE